MTKVEAVVIRERVETVIDAVEEETGHVGVTVIEAVGHGRQRGITHEYRGRVFESRFLPKALLTFIVEDELADAVVEAIADSARSGNESGDGLVWTSTASTTSRTTAPAAQLGGGGSQMRNKDLLIAANTIWVVLAAILVMFMQAGFAFLEAGLTRMKNAAHIAGKNVLIFGVCSLVYWAVGFGIAFGDGNSFIGTSGFFPSVNELLAIGQAPYSFFTDDPRREPATCSRSSSRASRSRSSGARWPSGRSCGSTSPSASSSRSSTRSPRTGSGSPAAGCSAKGMQDFAGSTVVHYQGALAALAGALLLGPRIGKFGRDGTREPDPGPQHAVRRPRDDHPLVRLVRLQPGLDAGRRHRRRIGYFGYVALTTNIAAAAGAVGGARDAPGSILRKPDISMMLNGVLAALVAITAASGFVAPWAAIVIGAVSGGSPSQACCSSSGSASTIPIGAVAVHGMSGVWGTLATGLFAVPALASNLATGKGGLVYTGSFHQLGVQALGLVTVGAFTFSACFGSLWVMKRVWGIRVEPEMETAGLDVSEHGMWGYPEFYIPVPGGYGTEAHGHLGLSHGHARTAPAPVVPGAAPEPAPG